MKYLIFTYDNQGNYSTSYIDNISGLDWTDKRVFELGDQGLYWEIFN